MAETPVLEIRDLSCSIGERTILKGIQLDVPAGETIVLLGRSGSGKTTLLKTVNGLIAPTGVTRRPFRTVRSSSQGAKDQPRATAARSTPKTLFGEPGGLQYPRAELDEARPRRPRPSSSSMNSLTTH